MSVRQTIMRTRDIVSGLLAVGAVLLFLYAIVPFLGVTGVLGGPSDGHLAYGLGALLGGLVLLVAAVVLNPDSGND